MPRSRMLIPSPSRLHHDQSSYRATKDKRLLRRPIKCTDAPKRLRLFSALQIPAASKALPKAAIIAAARCPSRCPFRVIRASEFRQYCCQTGSVGLFSKSFLHRLWLSQVKHSRCNSRIWLGLFSTTSFSSICSLSIRLSNKFADSSPWRFTVPTSLLLRMTGNHFIWLRIKKRSTSLIDISSVVQLKCVDITSRTFFWDK